MKGTLEIKSVCECNHRLGCRTLHPQASIINLEHQALKEDAVKFEFYSVLLVEECADGCCCGRKHYDYSSSTMVFLKPGEVFRMSEAGVLPDKGWLLAFHPDLLYHTSLKNNISNYTFFSYHREEALHLSKRETATIRCCLENIEEELHHSIDTHTATILSRHIELMLDYCARFYERQFITRESKNKNMMQELGTMIDDHIASCRSGNARLPESEYFAEKLGVSVPYFNDMLKLETGKTLDEHFQRKRLEAAKKMLLQTGNTAGCDLLSNFISLTHRQQLKPDEVSDFFSTQH